MLLYIIKENPHFNEKKINPHFKDKRAPLSLSSFATVSLYKPKKKSPPFSLSPFGWEMT